MKTEADVFRLYNEKFMPIYGDLIIVSGKKPPEILEQLESCMAHFAVAKTKTEDFELVQDNISAAYCHILRASLDTVKLLWTTLRENALKFVTDEKIRRFCTNASEGSVHAQYQKAQSISIMARRNEIDNVGINPEASIKQWYDAALEYKQLYELIDMDKVHSFKKHRLRKFIQNHMISFFLGVLASTVVAWGWPTCPLFAKAFINKVTNDQKASPSQPSPNALNSDN
jgi:hypothetical protein